MSAYGPICLRCCGTGRPPSNRTSSETACPACGGSGRVRGPADDIIDNLRTRLTTCINLHPHESLALLAGATALVRPFVLPGSEMHYGRPLNEWGLSSKPYQWDGADGEYPWEWCGRSTGARAGEWIMDLQTDVDDNCTVPCDQPVFPGSTLIGREAWRMTGADDCAHYEAPCSCRDDQVIYRADHRFPEENGPWLSPAVMPAALARHRYPVVSVEARELVDLDYIRWRQAGIKADHDQNVVEFARQQWLDTYGPDAWAGWVWVIEVRR